MTVFFKDKVTIRTAFEKAALSYDSAAILQREVSDRMDERLSYIKYEPACILDAGSGTGYGTRQLQKRYSSARIIELDLSHAMLQQSKRNVLSGQSLLKRWLAKTSTWQLVGDVEALPLAQQTVDMIWSNLTLQWMDTPQKVLSEFYRILKPGSLMMFSTFGSDTLKELKQAFSAVDNHVHVNQFLDMHDWGDALMHAEFEQPVVDMEKIVLTYDTLRDLMLDLKMIGARNAMTGRARGLMGKQTWQRLTQEYEAYRQNDQLPATYEVVYGHAWKPFLDGKMTSTKKEQVIHWAKR